MKNIALYFLGVGLNSPEDAQEIHKRLFTLKHTISGYLFKSLEEADGGQHQGWWVVVFSANSYDLEGTLTPAGLTVWPHLYSPALMQDTHHKGKIPADAGILSGVDTAYTAMEKLARHQKYAPLHPRQL
jgi:hypothetical protein